jgi:Tfp pilus assembly protein PilV
MHSTAIPCNARTRCCGFTLLEAIIALLLLMSCVIGIATLSAQNESVVRGGRLHAKAIELSGDIATRIAQSADRGGEFETEIAARCNTKLDQSKASHKQQVKNVVACWQDKVEQELPNGTARIELDRPALPLQYVVTISWSEPRMGTASLVKRVEPGTELKR